MRDVAQTGIKALDQMLSGGFTHGSIITVSGPTGCGKSTFGLQFLVNGITKYEEKGLYIILEETKISVYENTQNYKWDIKKLESEKKLVILDYPIHEVEQFLSKNSAIEELILTLGIERVVIDSIMPIALLFNNEDERQKGLLNLVENIRKWGTTTILISEDTSTNNPSQLPHTKYGIETLSDGWINLYYTFDEKTMERKRSLEIIKMKGVKHSTRVVPFEITENGIVIKLNDKVKEEKNK